MRPRFLRKTEEEEENEAASDGEPRLQRKCCTVARDADPLDEWHLVNTREAVMQVLQALPLVDGRLQVKHQEISGKWDG